MSFILRQINPHAQITDQAMLEAVESAIPQATVKAIVQERGIARQRRRKLSAEMGLLLVVAMNLFTHSSLAQVLMKLLKGFRYVWPNDHLIPASKGAISHLRYELGAAPVVDLFHRVCSTDGDGADPRRFPIRAAPDGDGRHARDDSRHA